MSCAVLLKNKRIHGIDDHLSEIVKRARAAAVGFRESAQAWSVVLALVAVLFNLIVPIYLNRSARFYLDLGAAGLFVAHYGAASSGRGHTMERIPLIVRRFAMSFPCLWRPVCAVSFMTALSAERRWRNPR